MRRYIRAPCPINSGGIAFVADDRTNAISAGFFV
jgi:hypothetical protein